MELGKAILKAVLIGGVAVLLVWKEREEILGLLGEPLEAGIAHAGHLVSFSFLMLVATLVLVVAADVPFQLWQYFHKLKMTKEEVKQEMKEMMGDPHVKGRIRSLQMQAARKRMMAAVPKANVVVTNPTHYAVALSYQTGMAAPKVVAKGVGAVALRIREVASENAVPIMEAPPLARALYKHTEIDAEIPSALYSAVAEVLAYIYQLANWRQSGGVPGAASQPAGSGRAGSGGGVNGSFLARHAGLSGAHEPRPDGCAHLDPDDSGDDGVAASSLCAGRFLYFQHRYLRSGSAGCGQYPENARFLGLSDGFAGYDTTPFVVERRIDTGGHA